MSEAECTPGPWEVGHDLVTKAPVVTFEGCDICRVEGYRGRSEAEANAKLIAASPSLLDAGRCAVDAITELVEIDGPTSTDWLNLRTARELLRNAIALAEGGAE